MKKLLLFAITGTFLISCGGGWSEEEQAQMIDTCPYNDEELCECLLDEAMEKWSSKEAMENEQEKVRDMDREERREFRKEMEKWEDKVEKKCMTKEDNWDEEEWEG